MRSNVNFEQLGPLAVAFGEYIKQLDKQDRVGTAEIYFLSLMSLAFIQEILGHTDSKTTQHYPDSFEIETKRKFSNSLMAFRTCLMGLLG